MDAETKTEIMKWIPVKGLSKGELPLAEVFVTNNAEAKTSHGTMSHIWVAYVEKRGKRYYGQFIPHGSLGSVTILDITHYCVPVFNQTH